MSDQRDGEDQGGRTALAGGLALALLSGAERAEAEQFAARDPAFAAEVEAWKRRFGLLPALLQPAAPPPGTFEAVMARVDGSAAAPSPAPPARGRSRAGAAALGFLGGLAVAAALTLTVLPHGSASKPPAHAPLAIAMLTPREGPPAFVVFYEADRLSLTVAPTAPWTAVDRAPELWLSPDGGEPVPIGRVSADRPTRISLPPALAARLSDAVVLVITSEAGQGDGGGDGRGDGRGDGLGPVRGPVVAHGPLVRV